MHSAIGGLLAVATLVATTSALAAEPAITPRPLQVVERAGAPVPIGDGAIVTAAPGDAEAAAAGRYLVDLTRRSGGPRLAIAAAVKGMTAIRFVRRAGLAPEGYTLDVGGDGATVTASTHAGFLYGAVSLWQLMAAAPDHRLQRLHIEDAPRFAWRGLVLDSARHFQSPAAIARMIDWMALHKLNRLQWHLADDQAWRLEIRRYPRLTSVGAWRSTPPAAGLVSGRYGGFYTQAQVRRLVAYAAARNVAIVPEIEMPGHATAAILAYPSIGLTTMTAANLGDWGVFPSIYGVDAPTFAFLHDVLDEVMALFPGREIAIGGDEAVHTLWRRNAAVQARMRALGLKDEDALQAWFVRQIGAYLNAHARRLVGWDEILGDGGLPAGDIVLSWHGADGALAAARSGHDVVMATAPTLYFDNRQSAASTEPTGRGLVVSLADVYAYDPGDPPHAAATPALDAAAATHVLGVEAALWSEHIATADRLEAMALPRAAALAEIGWTAAARRDWPGFVARLPAMLARYRALGLKAADGAAAVQPEVRRDGTRARVTLTRQIDMGELHYTTDGRVPTPASPRYAAPLDLALPARVRAASFAGSVRLSRELDLPLDFVSATRRVSQQLSRCTDQVSLNLPGRAAAGGGDGPVYLVDVKDPCWIYHDADLAGVGRIAAGVVALPFNYQFANEVNPMRLPPTATPGGELVVRRGCDGPVLATIPLAGAPGGGVESERVAPIAPQTGRADLCLRLNRPTLAPLWALGWVELRS